MADSTLRILLLADLKGLNANLNKAQTRLKAFSGRLKNIGGQLQTRLALPLIAAGGASIKMAADFDKSMTKIKTLVGVAGADVDAMAAGVKEMANVAGVSSGEAADALFFITSAGLRGADAMAVLEAATKASALGLGETATVADLATSALNAYGVENLSATGATDVLTAAVREGKLEASELSSVMGQVLPVASNMGVQFHEVGAAFAAMSRTGTPAAQAATQLNSILMAIMKPTQKSAEAMEQLGLSSKGLRQQIQDEGLLSVFQTLKTASEGNSEAFEQVFGNVRALKGILDLTGASAATTAEIFSRMRNTTGLTASAFEQLQNSAEFKLRKGLKQLQNSFTDLGAQLMDSLMPVLLKIMDGAKGMLVAFKNLSPQTKQLAIGFAGLAVVLPTVLTVAGSLIGVFSAIVSPIGLVAVAVAGAILYFDDLANAFVLFKNAVKFNVLRVLIRVNEFLQKYLIRPFKFAGKIINEVLKEGFGGDYGGLVDDFFKEGEQISKDAGKKLAENYVDEWEANTKERFDGSLNKLGGFLKDKLSTAFTGLGVTTGGEGTLTTALAFAGDEKEVDAIEQQNSRLRNDLKKYQQVLLQTEQTSKKLSDATTELAFSVGDSLFGAFQSLAEGGNFFAPLIQGLKKLVIRLAAAAATAAILFALTGGLSAGDGVSKLGKFKDLFTMFAGLPKFANGGIVSGPTLGLMGEYSGARSNPEVIAPLDKLRGMIAQTGGQNVNVGGEFRIQGQDLVVALQRAERNRKRIL